MKTVLKTHCQVVALKALLWTYSELVFRLWKVAIRNCMFLGEVFSCFTGRCFFEILVGTFDARDNFFYCSRENLLFSQKYTSKVEGWGHSKEIIHVHALFTGWGEKILFSVKQRDLSKQPHRYRGTSTWPSEQRQKGTFLTKYDWRNSFDGSGT